ncbi:hypothetical protein [Paenibacillus sp. MBLB4367]|uniref:hypothetical protein n=1 Tax=Paenibacillus sp. MBLB4367 TaxID=3384767 RepID=UPI0039080BAF
MVKRRTLFIRLSVAMTLLASTAAPLATPAVFAGKEGVFVSSDIYFTLDNVALSPGADDQTVRFGIELVNGSQSTFDYNGYGVRLVDTNGNSYSAQLTERSQARVSAGSSSKYKYIASIPKNIAPDQLKVDIFAWDSSQASYMRDLGMLSVAAVPVDQSQKGQIVVNLQDVNASQPDDAIVSFELANGYKAFVNGSWYLYANVIAENLSSSSLKLPSELSFDMKDTEGLTYALSSVTGADKTLLPHQRSMLVLQLPLGDGTANEPLLLELIKKAGTAASGTGGNGSSQTGSSGTGAAGGSSSASTAASADTDAEVLGTMNLSGSMKQTKAGDTIAYPSVGGSALSMVTERFTVVPMSEGTQVTGIFTLKNETAGVLPVPSISAGYQISQSTLSAAAADNAAGSHPAYLAGGESTTYSFTGTLPKGVDASSIQFVVWEKASATASLPVNVTEVPSGTGSSGSSSDGVYTSVGRLAFKVNSTYRLLTETGDDVVMSEIEVRNNDSKVVTLPAANALYGGLHIGSYDASGKAIYLQSSPLLNPGQATTVYVYTKIPYDTALSSGGSVYLGANDTKTTPAAKTEWIELPFSAKLSGPAEASLSGEWMINKAGQLSTGKVVESKIYDVGTQKMMAVRILQTNKATRNGSVVPYAGYAADANGNVWTLKATEDTTKLAKEGQELTTLWTTLPAGVSTDGWNMVFGSKIDADTFTNPQSYAFAVSPETGTAGGQISKASLYPYAITLQNAKLLLNANATYELSFDYTQEGQSGINGATKNRSIQLVLQDNNNTAVKTWEYALEKPQTTGTGTLAALESGQTNKMSVALNAIPDLSALINGPKLAVYEKFEGGTRLIGKISLSLY